MISESFVCFGFSPVSTLLVPSRRRVACLMGAQSVSTWARFHNLAAGSAVHSAAQCVSPVVQLWRRAQERQRASRILRFISLVLPILPAPRRSIFGRVRISQALI